MKKFLILLTFSVLVMGCVPSGSGDIATPEPRSTEQALVPVDSSPIETATQLPLRDRVTPNPAGQILDHTDWELDHAIIEGKIRELKSYEKFELYFRPQAIGIYDGCNHGHYDANPVYIASEDGEFVFPLREQGEDGLYLSTYISTAIACSLVDEESGIEHEIGIPEFVPPYEKIVAYELIADELRLYYPEDKRNVLVFKAIIFPPTETPTQIPETVLTAEAEWRATITAEAERVATMQALPTLTPSKTPIPPTAYPGQPPTATPVPTSMFYP